MAAEMDLVFLRRSFWTKVDMADPEGCWLWQQSTGSHGYGQTWDGITVRLAHRAAWELTNGRIPDDLTVDHVCRERRCCNPAHLRLLSNTENARLNGAAIKTHCKRGHEFDEANTYVNKLGHRTCRTCRRNGYSSEAA